MKTSAVSHASGRKYDMGDVSVPQHFLYALEEIKSQKDERVGRENLETLNSLEGPDLAFLRLECTVSGGSEWKARVSILLMVASVADGTAGRISQLERDLSVWANENLPRVPNALFVV